MRIGWLLDNASAVGGAELTQAEFRAAAPDGIEIVDCPAGTRPEGLDLYVVHNCVTYTREDLERMTGAPVVKYWHDIGPWMQDGVREWLDEHARYICCSPTQAEFMGVKAQCIPPPVNLDRFAQAAAGVNGNRAGSVCVASWRNAGKGQMKTLEWGEANGGIDLFGGGHLAPPGSREVPYDRMPELLASYQRFVFLPTVIEPFGRIVAEAWAAGCEVITNNLVGAKWWIENDPDAIETAAGDFWKTVLA